MEEISFSKGELIIEKGERNSNFYLIKKGIWRAYYLADGTENSLSLIPQHYYKIFFLST
jgi:CRP-like cAMP-binding protein